MAICLLCNQHLFPHNVRDMLDKKKFFPLSIASSFTVRTTLYPFTLVKTRLQIQRGTEVYKGTWDAFRKYINHL